MDEFDSLKKELGDFIKARGERKEAKRKARTTIRGTKRRDALIQQKESTAALARRDKDSQKSKRKAFDLMMTHMVEVHQRQIKDQIAAQERKMQYERKLNEMESRSLKEEARRTMIKKYHVRENYQNVLNKRLNEQLREYQLLETRHAKERYDCNTSSFEAVCSMRIRHLAQRADLNAKHVEARHLEKEEHLSVYEEEKLKFLVELQQKQLNQLQIKHQISLAMLQKKHRQSYANNNNV